MKRYLLVLLAITVVSVLVFLVVTKEKSVSNPKSGEPAIGNTFNPDDAIDTNEGDTPLGSVVNTANTQERITQALLEKNDWEPGKIEVRVMQQTGKYYAGAITFTQETGGGLFYAVEDSGKIKIVFDGNGAPVCTEIDRYDFPTRMIPECMDVDTGELIKR